MSANKFTATLVHPADKDIVVQMRDACGLSEKDLMTLIIAKANEHRDEIIATGKARVDAEKAEREQRRKDNYEKLKEKMKAARAEVKAEKQAEKEAKPAKKAKKTEMAEV